MHAAPVINVEQESPPMLGLAAPSWPSSRSTSVLAVVSTLVFLDSKPHTEKKKEIRK
jgi:hypothetical protein